MTSLTTTPEETWVSDFGPVPFDSLDLANQQYEVRSYWLADFKLKAISEALAFAARFDSPEVFSAYMDIKGDEGYVTFEIKGNTRPLTIALRYMADRWRAVDGKGAHIISKNADSETVKSRGETTIFHAFLDAELIEKVCNQLEISIDSQPRLFTRINFKEKTFSLVAPEDAPNDFPQQKPYKTSIIPKSQNKTGESMNAQEEKADATQALTASVEPTSEPTTSESSATEADAAKIEHARAEVVAWATSSEEAAAAPVESTPEETKESVEAGVPEQAVQAEVDPQVVTADPVPTVEADAPAPALTEAPAEVPSAPVEAAAPEQASAPAEPPVQAEAAPEQPEVTSGVPVEVSPEVAAAPVDVPKANEQAHATAPVEVKEKGNKEFFTPNRNAAKSSEPGVLGKLAVKGNEEKSNRDNSGRDKSVRENSGKDNAGRDNSAARNNNSPRDNAGRDNSARNSNASQNRTNFAPQSNRSIEAPRPVESTPKYHTYSQSEVDSLIKKSAENVTASVASKINKQTKTVEDTLKDQDFAFKQALAQLQKESEAANQKLNKAVAELTSASAKQKDEFKDSLTKEIEEFKSQMNKKVNQGIKVIDTKLEQVAEVKVPKQKQAPAQTPSPKATAKAAGLSANVQLAIVGVFLLLCALNAIVIFGINDRLATLENASKVTPSSSSSSDVPIPDLMKDQINKENGTAPTPVQP